MTGYFLWYLLLLTEMYCLFWYPCYMLLVELREPRCKFSSPPLSSSKNQKGQSRDNYIITLLKNLNVDGLNNPNNPVVIFLSRKSLH